MRGGLRTRLVLDSARLAVIAGLSALKWFDPTVYDDPPGLRHHRPVRYVPRPAKWDEPVYVNAIAISAENIYDGPLGFGGEVEDTNDIYVDVFAESDVVGWQISLDVRDILLGKFPELDRSGPVIDVYDLRQATPAPFTQVDVENVLVDRAQGQARQWQAHWFMTRASLVDDYSDEAASLHTTTDWTDDYAVAWQRIQAIEAYA